MAPFPSASRRPDFASGDVPRVDRAREARSRTPASPWTARLSAGILLLLALSASPALAQDARAREAAANAFDRGTEAYLSEDFDGAARWFERAYDMAPAAPAIYQAIRSHLRAENERRAAELMARLQDRFPESGEAERVAPLLAEIAPRYTRVATLCSSACTIEVDDVVVADAVVFLEDGPHLVRATFDSGPVEREVDAQAGAALTLEFEAPPPLAGTSPAPLPSPTTGPTTTPASAPTAPTEEPNRGGVHPAAFGTLLALTAAAGGVLIWSGVDVLQANDEYERVALDEMDIPRARELLAAGEDAELRTNILIGVTGALAATSLVLAIVTDWGGDEDDPAALQPTLLLGPGSVYAGVQGSFGAAAHDGSESTRGTRR